MPNFFINVKKDKASVLGSLDLVSSLLVDIKEQTTSADLSDL
ncbi:MAG: hypothetical protein NY202_01270 [Mollicutes bacterium UO1]